MTKESDDYMRDVCQGTVLPSAGAKSMSKRSGGKRFARHWARIRRRLPWAFTPNDIKWARSTLVDARTILNHLMEYAKP